MQRDLAAPLFPRAGSKSKREKRELASAVLCLAGDGCKRRNPRTIFRTARPAGFWYAAIKSGLMQRKFRRRLSGSQGKRRGAITESTYGIIDSRGAKAAGSGEERGMHGEKK